MSEIKITGEENDMRDFFDLNNDGKISNSEQAMEEEFILQMNRQLEEEHRRELASIQQEVQTGNISTNANTNCDDLDELDDVDIDEIKTALEDAGMNSLDVDLMDNDELMDLLDLAGLDPDEIYLMDTDDLRQALEDAGIDF